jgi:hypothetical protein
VNKDYAIAKPRHKRKHPCFFEALPRQERIRKKQIPSIPQNKAPVEGHINPGGGVSMGRGSGGDQRDQGGGARRAQKHGEG